MSSDRASLHLRFADETGLHGLKPFLASKTRSEWIVWAVVLLYSVLALTRGVAMVVMQYADEPTFTDLTVFTPKKFPEIALCDTHYGSIDELTKMGISIEEYVALGRILPITPLFVTTNVTPSHGMYWQNASAAHDRVVERFGHVYLDDIFSGMLADPGDAITVVPAQRVGVGNVSVEKSNKASGPCYLIRNSDGLNDVNADVAHLLVFARNLPTPTPAGWLGRSRRLHVGDGAAPGSFSVGVDLGVGLRYSISIQARVLRMINRRGSKCKAYSAVECSTCRASFLREKCVGEGHKPFYMPGRGDKAADVAFALDSQDCEIPREAAAVAEFVKACPKPCEENIYEVSTTFTGMSSGEADFLQFFFTHARSSLVAEEKRVMTSDDLLSSIGGQLSLFSGASLLTIVHILMFCCCRLRQAVSPSEPTFE